MCERTPWTPLWIRHWSPSFRILSLDSASAYKHPRGYFWLRIPNLKSHPYAKRHHYRTLDKVIMLNNRQTESKNAIEKNVSAGQFTTQEPNNTKNTVISDKQLTTQANKIRHNKRVRLDTRYGHFWVLAEDSFRQPLDSLASGIIG